MVFFSADVGSHLQLYQQAMHAQPLTDGCLTWSRRVWGSLFWFLPRRYTKYCWWINDNAHVQLVRQAWIDDTTSFRRHFILNRRDFDKITQCYPVYLLRHRRLITATSKSIDRATTKCDESVTQATTRVRRRSLSTLKGGGLWGALCKINI